MRRLLAALAMIAGLEFPCLAQESANATTIPVASQIVDSDGAVWTLRLSDRAILKNGIETGLTNVLELWYLDHAVWAFTGTRWLRHIDRWQTTGQAAAWPAHPALPTAPGLRLPVGPQPRVTCSGVAVNPGDNIQKIVNANPAGTTYCLAIGTYNRQSIIPKDGDQYICAYDGANGAVLDGQQATTYAFHGAANYVVVRNCFVRNYNNATQFASVQVLGRYFLFQNNDVSGATRGAGVWASDYAVIIANRLHNNAQEGYKVVVGPTLLRAAVGVLFDSNEIDHNNPSARTWAGGEQGGGKAVWTEYLSFWYNYSHDNRGPAFWTDWNNIYTTYWYNKSLGDSGGIEHEGSYNASIVGNDIELYAGPGRSACPTFFFACGGVMIENSGGSTGAHAGIIEIAYNTIRPGQYGRSITMRQQNRGSGDRYSPGDFRSVRNIWIHHNTIDWSAATGVNNGQIGAVQDTGDTKLFFSNNIRIDYNTYVRGAKANQFVWKNVANNPFSTWQSYGFDLHGSAK